MFEAVFIADLHLHPNESSINERFCEFIEWARSHTQAVYILGDFFHAWAGDDEINAWSKEVAERLRQLTQNNIALYFMPGNRDFLLGSHFAQLANMTLLLDPTVITWDNSRILLTHGDRYCIQDRSHQWFRRIVQHKIFTRIFLSLPLTLRLKWVHQLRSYSKTQHKNPLKLQAVPAAIIRDMEKNQAEVVIHGHIHSCGFTQHQQKNKILRHYVLSDWVDKVILLGYNKPNGFDFIQI